MKISIVLVLWCAGKQLLINQIIGLSFVYVNVELLACSSVIVKIAHGKKSFVILLLSGSRSKSSTFN